MNSASRYWRLIKIDAAGKRKIEEISSVKAFFLESFPEFTAQSEVPDALIQRKLLHWSRQAIDANQVFLAKRCLQCFISNQIDQVCQKLAVQFGTDHNFTSSDLLPFVLNDDGNTKMQDEITPASSYKSLTREILESFDPEQSSLATWTTRRVKHHRELNAFLLQHGVYLVSDWAILNDTNPKQIQRIFSQFHHLTAIEVQQASQLLESYHAVYRSQRLKQRQSGINGKCLPPTTDQLHQIAKRLLAQTTQLLAPETLIAQLQEMASRLREYRIYVRGGSLPTESLSAPDSDAIVKSISSQNLVNNDNEPDEQTEFLNIYRQQFLICLDQALTQVINQRMQQLQRRNPEKAQKFFTALQLFHCRGKSMTEIASIVNLPAQYSVAKLLKLKSLRADVQQRLLVLLKDCVFDHAQAYTNPERLQSLNQQIEEALNEQINRVIKEEETNASIATSTKNRIPNSLFAKRLCYQLDVMITQP